VRDWIFSRLSFAARTRAPQSRLDVERKFTREHERAIAHESSAGKRSKFVFDAYLFRERPAQGQGLLGVTVMRKLLIGLTAAAALALAVPGTAMAQHHGGDGHGVGGHASGGGHGGGGNASRGMSLRSSGMSSRGMSRNMQGNRGISARGMHANRGLSARSHRAHRNFASQNFTSNRSINARRLARANVNTSRVNRQAAVNGRHHHRHHRHHRGGGWWYPGFAYYDDYAGYDTCYQYLWTPRGYRYVNTCASDYYGVY
jgi:hypothetical protein